MIDLDFDWPATPAPPPVVRKTTEPQEARGSSSQMRAARAVEMAEEGEDE